MALIDHSLQFERDGNDWIYYRTNVSKGHRLSNSQKERLIEALEKSEGRALRLAGILALAVLASLFVAAVEITILFAITSAIIFSAALLLDHRHTVNRALPRGEPTEPRKIKERMRTAGRASPLAPAARRLILKIAIAMTFVSVAFFDVMLYMFFVDPAQKSGQLEDLLANDVILIMIGIANILPLGMAVVFYVILRRLKD